MRDLGIYHTYKVFKTHFVKSRPMYFSLLSEYLSKLFLYVPVEVSGLEIPVHEGIFNRHTRAHAIIRLYHLTVSHFFRIYYCCQIGTKCLLTLIRENKILSNYNGIGK